MPDDFYNQGNESPNCASWIAPPPRKLSIWVKWRIKSLSSKEMSPYDPLTPTTVNQIEYLKRGYVVWAHIIQANEELFKRGAIDLPADIVFSSELSGVDPGPTYLAKISSRMFRLKHTHPSDPDERRIADELTDEFSRFNKVPVPKAFSPNFPLFRSTLLICRKHLPGGYLAMSYFPVLMHPNLPFARVLPSRFWSPEFIAKWEDHV